MQCRRYSLYRIESDRANARPRAIRLRKKLIDKLQTYNAGTSFHSTIKQPIDYIDFEPVTLEIWLNDEKSTL